MYIHSNGAASQRVHGSTPLIMWSLKCTLEKTKCNTRRAYNAKQLVILYLFPKGGESRPITGHGGRPLTGGVQYPLPFMRPDTGSSIAFQRPETGRNTGFQRPETGRSTGFQGDGASRPSTSGRPSTSRPISSGRRGLPGTASRLISTASVQRPGTRSGLATGIGFNTPITVEERPITREGVSAMKTGSKGQQRKVQDKSYYMGLLRKKYSELISEVGKLKKETEGMKEEQSSFLTYDKKVKEVAQELCELQGTLADYNALVDLMNTDTEQAEVIEDMMELKEENDHKMSKLDSLFSQKQEKENYMRQLENEIEEARHMGENLIAAMNPGLKEKFMELRNVNSALMHDLDIVQQEIDNLDTKRQALEDELSLSKVKEDNAEIATMERQMGDVSEEISRASEDLHHLEQDLDENKSERSKNTENFEKEKKRCNNLWKLFDENKREELNKLGNLESNVVAILEKISKNMSHFGNLPSSHEFTSMRSDLTFKEGELKKSQYTEQSLRSEHLNLQANLQRIEALESKVAKEKVDLQNRLEKMEKEIDVFSDINGLKRKMEEKRIQLAGEKDDLELKKQSVSQSLKDVTNQINMIKKQLSENETHSQLQNLEKKWAHLELNNFVLKEFIAQKRSESNFIPLKNQAMNLVIEYNKFLQNIYQSGGSLA
ncbi:Intraflagellar transport protein 74-like protein [Armadillidium vulgare]|nr:Intraflagellar transport protein 74-like protein [Armadillidium vulgare]